MQTEVSCLAADSLESDSLASAFDDDEPSPFFSRRCRRRNNKGFRRLSKPSDADDSELYFESPSVQEVESSDELLLTLSLSASSDAPAVLSPMPPKF